MQLHKIYTVYSILKLRQCVFLTQSKSNQASALYLMHCLVTTYLHSLYTIVELHTNVFAVLSITNITNTYANLLS